ncbi:Ppx/GppA family phosphatase [candidate division KSB3 bacterium]|uniref:Ppx/GppA family phosphatase n=1 Tax=candidate division KSB3 bacterium TaxID=2044937 RepID=A0A9D5JTW1_9BACT|nr:Ppx/GppA family phosphatase [candidate division KSB3 bacterium]MBD3324137.1 Ppx/GppA family phosphatase [candidate division KSB3 bacterium]
MPKYAVLDIGTHSIKLHIAEQQENGDWRVVLDSAEISRLGEGFQATGDLQPEAMARNVQVLQTMLARLRQYDVQQVVAVGTMGLRTANNAQAFVHRVQQECGLAIEILSGDEEARLISLAVASEFGEEDGGTLVIFDSGGGSTEFIFRRQGIVEQRMSVNVGALRYTEQILTSDPVTPDEFDRAVATIAADLAKVPLGRSQIGRLVGLGGIMTNLGAVKHRLAVYDAEVVHGTTLTRQDVTRQLHLYCTRTIESRKRIAGLQPQRADVILAGAAIVGEIMRQAHVETATISDRGLRHGLIRDRFAG